MKSFLKITLFIIFLLPLYNLQAHLNFNYSELIKGTVLDDSTELCIPFANIFNESKRNWDYANEKGEFSIWVNLGDTLVFSAVGYLSTVIFITDSFMQQNLIIKLEPRTYEIGEVTIKSLKKYSKFKQDFLNLKLPRTSLDSISEELAKSSKYHVLEAIQEKKIEEALNRNNNGNFLHTGMPILTKKKKEKAFKRILKNTEQQKIINTKYNREIVYKLTNLTGSDLTEFMTFCNFSVEFLMDANDYEIIKNIYVKLDEYKKVH